MTPPGAPPFLEDNDWLLVTFAALLVAPWAALAAISLPPPVTAYQSGRSSIRAGRAYAAYGGIYIAASLVWLWLVEGQQPTASDMICATITIIGALVVVGFAIAVASNRFSVAAIFRTTSRHRYTSFRSPIFTTTTISSSSTIW